MAFKPHRDSRPMAERSLHTQIEAEFFQHISGFLTKKEQGKVMGAFREVLAGTNADIAKLLNWSVPLAIIAVDQYRMERVKAGHHDITGTYSNGETWVGIYQTEVDEIEFARKLLKLVNQ